jgi:hypothetical protein
VTFAPTDYVPAERSAEQRSCVSVAAQRLLTRDGEGPRERYLRGQELYFAEADPRRHAALVLPR